MTPRALTAEGGSCPPNPRGVGAKAVKLLQSFRFLLLLPWLVAATAQAATKLLPGVTYYEGREALRGKLVFLLSRDVTQKTNSATSASIYEFDLSEKKLRKVTDAPQGGFFPSNDGDIYCVIYREEGGRFDRGSVAFIYTVSLRLIRSLNLESEPRRVIPVAGHVFFVMDHTNGTRLLDYDIARDQKRPVEFTDASGWQYQDYKNIHVPRGLTNILHFFYKGFGKRLGDGKDYRSGYYSLEVATGNRRWFADSLDDKDDESHTSKASDGRYVFFEGPSAPVIGSKLVSSPLDFMDTESEDPKGDKVRVIKVFSNSFWRLGTSYFYFLRQMSPDGRYVLVILSEPSVPKSMMQSGEMTTYFLVDVSNGETRVLLKENVQHVTLGSMSAVRWIR